MTVLVNGDDDAAEGLFKALTTKRIQEIVERMRAENRFPIHTDFNDSRCGYCNTLDRFGDFATERVRGTLILVCDACRGAA